MPRYTEHQVPQGGDSGSPQTPPPCCAEPGSGERFPPSVAGGVFDVEQHLPETQGKPARVNQDSHAGEDTPRAWGQSWRWEPPSVGPRSVCGQQDSAISALCSVSEVCARPWSPDRGSDELLHLHTPVGVEGPTALIDEGDRPADPVRMWEIHGPSG